jgi:holo-[acyl-carrier protein] synthase
MRRLRNGVDLIEIDRVRLTIERYGSRFLERVYTPLELVQAHSKPASLAARFAGKEAVSKALGCGIGMVGWREIEIRRDDAHPPQVVLYGEADLLAKSLGLTQWTISLSHTQDLAIAFVVAVEDREPENPY